MKKSCHTYERVTSTDTHERTHTHTQTYKTHFHEQSPTNSLNSRNYTSYEEISAHVPKSHFTHTHTYTHTRTRTRTHTHRHTKHILMSNLPQIASIIAIISYEEILAHVRRSHFTHTHTYTHTHTHAYKTHSHEQSPTNSLNYRNYII